MFYIDLELGGQRKLKGWDLLYNWKFLQAFNFALFFALPIQASTLYYKRLLAPYEN